MSSTSGNRINLYAYLTDDNIMELILTIDGLTLRVDRDAFNVKEVKKIEKVGLKKWLLLVDK